MNPLFLFLGLLALAYMGTLLAGDRRIRGFGLPSGAEYLVLGFLLGPSALDLVDRSILEVFDPITHVALGWIALVLGLGFGVHRRGETKASHVLLGAAASLTTAVLIAAPFWFVVTHATALRGQDRILLVAGAALACAETTRESVRWVAERYGAKGPLATIISAMAEADDVVPVLLLVGCFSMNVSAHLPWPMNPLRWAGLTLGLGVAFGVTAAMMIGRELETDETWGTLLGVSVLGTGVTTLLGLSELSAMFAMGIALAVFSGHRQALLAMVEPSERTVLHPVLLLAGARVNLHAGPALPVLVVTVLAARTAAKGVIGLVWQAASAPARKAGPLLGLSLLSAGTLCITVGLACAMRFPGVVGDTVLLVAAASTLFGELVGPFALRAALLAAGEILPESPKTEPHGPESAESPEHTARPLSVHPSAPPQAGLPPEAG